MAGPRATDFDMWQASAEAIASALRELGLAEIRVDDSSSAGACATATVTRKMLADLDKHTVTPAKLPEAKRRRQVSVERVCMLASCGEPFTATAATQGYCSDEHARQGKAARARARKAAARAERQQAMV